MTITQKEKYERTIEKYVEDNLLEKHPELLKELEKSSIHEKRMKLLYFLDPDEHTFLRMIKIAEQSLDKKTYIKELVKMFREYVKVTDVERKKFAEIMTPTELVEEMLDTLPKKVWSDPSLKWLDPANGVGIFPAVIVERLMDGLEQVIPDIDDRYQHIMENMIYAAELQGKNAFLYLTAFDPLNEYDLNIYNGSFLDEDFENHANKYWNIVKFDIVVGNPPYQHSTNKRWKLWVNFVDKGLKINKKNGYFVFVTPQSWLNGAGKELENARQNITQRELKFVQLNLTYFTDVAEKIGYFFLKNTFNKTKKTKINNNFEKFEYLVENKKNPVSTQDIIFRKIFENIENKQPKIQGKVFLTDVKHDLNQKFFHLNGKNKFKFLIVHTASQIYGSNNAEYEKMVGPKLIVNMSGYFYNDKFPDKYMRVSTNEIAGRGAVAIYTKNIEEAENLKSFLKSKLIQSYVIKNKTSGFNWDCFSNIPVVDVTKKWTDHDVYTYFNLTQDEINLIEETIK